MKAKYYVDLGMPNIRPRFWHRQGPVGGKRRSMDFVRWLLASYTGASARVRYRGKVIARWRDGKRVK